MLLTKLLLYAYMQGVVSSRAIAAKTYADVAFRVLAVDQHPDFRTISDFRERHLAALGDLFLQVVRLARRLGLARLEQVAQDGTKILANASKHHAMSYARMQDRPRSGWRGNRGAAGGGAGGRCGRGCPARPGPERGRAAAGAERGDRPAGAAAGDDPRGQGGAGGGGPGRGGGDPGGGRGGASAARGAGEPKKPGKPPAPPDVPAPTAQRNFTDPESRIMQNADKAFVQAYNGQVAVDARRDQIISAVQ